MKKTLLSLCILMVSALCSVPAMGQATLKAFLDGLQKGKTATFTGEAVVTYADDSYVFVQDETAAFYLNSYDCPLKTGDKFTNAEISRAQFGSNYYYKGGSVIAENQTIEPKVITINQVPAYKYWLVKVEHVNFQNAGFPYGTTSGGDMMEQPVSVNGIDGIVQPFLCNLANAIVPKEANVTGIAWYNDTPTFRPRNAEDVEILQHADMQDETFAHFKQSLTFSKPATFDGELTVSLVVNDANTTVVYQDETAGAYYYTGNTDLKAGDKIKDVNITRMTDQDDQWFMINSYTLVSQNNSITPVEVEFQDLAADSQYAYMMVTIKNMSVEQNATGLMTANTAYKIYPEDYHATTPAFATNFCTDLVGRPLPLKANFTGINMFGYQIRPIELSGVEVIQSAQINIPDCANIAAFKALGNTEVVKLTDNVTVIQTQFSNEGADGTLVIQDATGGLNVRVTGTNAGSLKIGDVLKNVYINNNNTFGMPQFSPVDGEFCEITGNEPVTPNEIAVGDFNASSRAALDYTLVKYSDVTFSTEDKTFVFGTLYTVEGNNRTATIYPYDQVVGADIPSKKCDVIGVAIYNTELSTYTVCPRTGEDIKESTAVGTLDSNVDGPVFNLAGVRVADTLSSSALPAGFYICNGRKVVVK